MPKVIAFFYDEDFIFATPRKCVTNPSDRTKMRSHPMSFCMRLHTIALIGGFHRKTNSMRLHANASIVCFHLCTKPMRLHAIA